MNRSVKSRLVTTTLLTFGFCIPFALIVVFYALVLRTLKSRGHSIGFFFGRQRQTDNIETGESFRKNVKPTAAMPARVYARTQSVTLKLNGNLINIENRSKKRLIRNLRSPSNSQVRFVTRLSTVNLHLRNFMIRREIHATKTVVMFVGFFCVSWLPYAVIVLLAHLGTSIENYVTPLTASLPAIFAKTSIVFNPLIYTLTNRQCKSHLKRMFGVI